MICGLEGLWSGAGERNSQFQESEIRIAVVCPILALLGHVILEHGCRLGIVSIEAVENGIDVFWPIRRVVEGDAHDGCCGTSEGWANMCI